jgi:hypothetical protein
MMRGPAQPEIIILLGTFKTIAARMLAAMPASVDAFDLHA